ncbi:MAG: TetR/AcrR family transcriptional regulator [Actinomycetota bacterium]
MRLPAGQRRSQLLAVARERFATQGFHATSMDDIAEAAGVTKPVVYQHFPSKHALYAELLTDTSRRLLTTLEAATRGAGTGRTRVEEGFRAYFRFAAEDRSSFLLLLGADNRAEPDFARIVDGTLDACAAAVSTLIDLPASAEQRLVLAHALVGMAEAATRSVLHAGDRTPDPDDLAAWIAELAWFGLRGVRPGGIDERDRRPDPRR